MVSERKIFYPSTKLIEVSELSTLFEPTLISLKMIYSHLTLIRVNTTYKELLKSKEKSKQNSRSF